MKILTYNYATTKSLHIAQFYKNDYFVSAFISSCYKNYKICKGFIYPLVLLTTQSENMLYILFFCLFCHSLAVTIKVLMLCFKTVENN